MTTMTLSEIINRLNEDLQREYAHWHFYLSAATAVTGLHREELSEFFLEAAQSEMKHIEQFRRLIIGLGGTPTRDGLVGCQQPFNLNRPEELIDEALRMELEVVDFYVQRIEDAEALYDAGDRANGKYIEIFLEDQLLDSRSDADNLKEMRKI